MLLARFRLRQSERQRGRIHFAGETCTRGLIRDLLLLYLYHFRPVNVLNLFCLHGCALDGWRPCMLSLQTSITSQGYFVLVPCVSPPCPKIVLSFRCLRGFLTGSMSKETWSICRCEFLLRVHQSDVRTLFTHTENLVPAILMEKRLRPDDHTTVIGGLDGLKM